MLFRFRKELRISAFLSFLHNIYFITTFYLFKKSFSLQSLWYGAQLAGVE